MVGFALAIPGTRDGHAYLHSQMVGVREEFRNSGLGRRIKWFQRDDALARGFELMEWTFDPLEIKNAYLNIEKLGAIARRYNVNQYGLTSSPLQGGLPTDRSDRRVVAELTARAARRKMGQRCSAIAARRLFRYRASIYDGKLVHRCATTLKSIQDNNRALFIKAFADGLSVLNFNTRCGRKRYLFAWALG